MIQPVQLSEEEFDERYHITGRRRTARTGDARHLLCRHRPDRQPPARNTEQRPDTGPLCFCPARRKHDFLVACSIRHITKQETRTVLHWRIGLEFASLSTAEENRIQRYIARVEHERRETS